MVNAERKKEQLNKVTYETFEILMDRLEKEWFDLVCAFENIGFPTPVSTILRQTKNLPKPDLALPSEDLPCAICGDSEGENSNAIVFCDGCNLAVHQGRLTAFSFLYMLNVHQTATEYHTSQKANGYVESAQFLRKIRWYVIFCQCDLPN